MLRHQREPVVATAVQVQQLAKAGPRLPAAPMPAPGALPGHQAGGLQGLLDEGIAEPHPVLAPGNLHEVANVEPQGALPGQGQDPLQLGHVRALEGDGTCRRRSNKPA